LTQSGDVSMTEARFTNYFNRLGYTQARVTEVVATFVGAGIAHANPHRTADSIRQKPLFEVGTISLVKKNANQYFEKLLKSPWYFICVKGDVYVPDHLIQTDADGLEYVTDNDFVDFLKEEEDLERRRISDFTKRNGNNRLFPQLMQPWTMAKEALNKRHNRIVRHRDVAAS
jgi:hypothetical protein